MNAPRISHQKPQCCCCTPTVLFPVFDQNTILLTVLIISIMKGAKVKYCYEKVKTRTKYIKYLT